MKVFETDVELGEEITVGGFERVPAGRTGSDGPIYLTGPEAFDKESVQVEELDPPRSPTCRSPTSPICLCSSSRARCW